MTATAFRSGTSSGKWPGGCRSTSTTGRFARRGVPAPGERPQRLIQRFDSIDRVKAGVIKTRGGRRHLTEEGKQVTSLPAETLLDKALHADRDWKAKQAHTQSSEPLVQEDREPDVVLIERSFVLEKAEGEARSASEACVVGLGPREVPDVVAALPSGMGCSTPFEASRGPDGGSYVLAQPDPIGAKTPHIRVQAKRRPAATATRVDARSTPLGTPLAAMRSACR